MFVSVKLNVKFKLFKIVNTFHTGPIFGYFPFRPRGAYTLINFASELCLTIFITV